MREGSPTRPNAAERSDRSRSVGNGGRKKRAKGIDKACYKCYTVRATTRLALCQARARLVHANRIEPMRILCRPGRLPPTTISIITPLPIIRKRLFFSPRGAKSPKEEEKGEGTGGAARSAPSRRRGAEAPKRRRLCFSHSRRFPIGGYYDTPQWVTCDM